MGKSSELSGQYDRNYIGFSIKKLLHMTHRRNQDTGDFDMNARFVKWGTLAVAALVSLAFLAAGSFKLSGAEQMVQSFERYGFPVAFMYFIGLCEVAGAIGLWLSPAFIRGWPLKRLAASGLAIIMVGAVGVHLINDPIAMALPAVVLLALTLLLAYAFGPGAREGSRPGTPVQG